MIENTQIKVDYSGVMTQILGRSVTFIDRSGGNVATGILDKCEDKDVFLLRAISLCDRVVAQIYATSVTGINTNPDDIEKNGITIRGRFYS